MTYDDVLSIPDPYEVEVSPKLRRATAFDAPVTRRVMPTARPKPVTTTPANKPYDKAFENALRHSRMRIGMRYVGD
jgi:hypothetical protein